MGGGTLLYMANDFPGKEIFLPLHNYALLSVLSCEIPVKCLEFEKSNGNLCCGISARQRLRLLCSSRLCCGFQVMKVEANTYLISRICLLALPSSFLATSPPPLNPLPFFLSFFLPLG